MDPDLDLDRVGSVVEEHSSFDHTVDVFDLSLERLQAIHHSEDIGRNRPLLNYLRQRRTVLGGKHANVLAPRPSVEVDLSFPCREQSIVAPKAHKLAGVHFRPALPDEYGSRRDYLASISLDPQALRLGVTSIP